MKNFRLFFFTLITLYLAGASLANAQFIGFFLNDNRKRVSFDIEIYNNLIVIPVILEEKMPLKFILDTGVSSAILFEKGYSDILGLDYSRKISIMGVGREKDIEAYVATGLRLDLPGIKGYRQSMLVLEEDYLQLEHQLGTEVHGIIGYELFRKFVVEIDYDDKKLTFHDGRYYRPGKRWIKFPVEIVETKPYIKLPLWIEEGKHFDGNFMIDTGASHSILIQEQSDEELYVPEKQLKASLGKGLSGDIFGSLARIHKLKIGKFQFNRVIASFPDEESYGDSVMNVQKNGTLGGEILSRFNVAFDYLGEAVYLKRGAHYKDEFEYNMSGIDISAFGPEFKDLKVSKIRKGSPADSVGIKVDDILLSINGLSGDILTISNAYKMFNSREGRKLRLILLREDEKIRKKLILKKAI